MNAQQPVRIAMDRQLLDRLDALAKASGCSRDHLMETAALRFVDEEQPADEAFRGLPPPPAQPGMEILDEASEAMRRFIQEGIDALDRGDTVPHEQVFAKLRGHGRRDAA